jgi:predicted secreted hydrolase
MAMRKIAVVIINLLLVMYLASCQGRQQPSLVQASFVSVAGNEENIAGFARANPERRLSFPNDFGAHPDYRTEWWYYTGNLIAVDGRRFGYQLTFFRRALLPPNTTTSRASSWATTQVYMAHFAFTDSTKNQHQAYEQLSRGAAGLAGAQPIPFKVWIYNWYVEQTGINNYDLHAAQGNLAINLNLTDSKGPILNGNNGYSQKGPEPGNASYYYSLTRLLTEGSVQIDDVSYVVNGTSWMDHEFSTNALSKGQTGWDWFSIQLDDNSELMFYQIRREDGSIDPFSSGTIIQEDGSTRHLRRGDFNIAVTDTWYSPHSKATYPSKWAVTIPSEGITLEISPLVKDQEMNLSYSYWEGAVDIRGERKRKPINGSGYVELTGYAGSISGQF